MKVVSNYMMMKRMMMCMCTTAKYCQKWKS